MWSLPREFRAELYSSVPPHATTVYEAQPVLAHLRAAPRESRARAETLTYIPNLNDDASISNQGPLAPESDLSAYTPERLEKGLAFASAEGRRNISPMTKNFLEGFKDLYKAALETPSEDILQDLQGYERVYHSHHNVLFSQTEADFKLNAAMLTLRRMEFLANYGDYAGFELAEFREESKPLRRHPEKHVRQAVMRFASPNLWQDIAENLGPQGLASMKTDLHTICQQLNLDAQHMEFVICEYGERNKTFHNQTAIHIRECNWPALAQQIHRDFNELPQISNDTEEVENYRQLLMETRERWFDARAPHDLPQHWMPSPRAYVATEALYDRERKQGVF